MKKEKQDHTNICPVHEDFKDRVNRLGEASEKEDDSIWKKLYEHETRINHLEGIGARLDIIENQSSWTFRLILGFIILYIIKTFALI